MKVLHLTRDFPPHHRGGISSAVDGLVTASVEAGLNCSVISFDGWRGGRSGSGEPRLHTAPNGVAILRAKGPAHLEQARAFAMEFAPDLIHIHHSMLWDFARELGAVVHGPLLQSVHVLQAEQNRLRGIHSQTLSLEAQERALAGAQLIHAPSESVADRLRFFYPDVTPRIRVAPLGIAEAELPQEACDERGDFILYVGRFADIKGTNELFETMVSMHEMEPRVRWVIAGGIPENGKSERRWLRRWEQFSTPEIRENVDFCGWCDASRLNSLYRSASVVVCPSWYETFGMVALEAMNHGAPLVASKVGGLAELVEHGVTGLLIPPQDATALASGVLSFLAEPDMALRMGAAGRARVEHKWRWPKVLPALIGLYEELL